MTALQVQTNLQTLVTAGMDPSYCNFQAFTGTDGLLHTPEGVRWACVEDMQATQTYSALDLDQHKVCFYCEDIIKLDCGVVANAVEFDTKVSRYVRELSLLKGYRERGDYAGFDLFLNLKEQHMALESFNRPSVMTFAVDDEGVEILPVFADIFSARVTEEIKSQETFWADFFTSPEGHGIIERQAVKLLARSTYPLIKNWYDSFDVPPGLKLEAFRASEQWSLASGPSTNTLTNTFIEAVKLAYPGHGVKEVRHAPSFIINAFLADGGCDQMVETGVRLNDAILETVVILHNESHATLERAFDAADAV